MSKADVDAAMEQARKAGAVITDPAHDIFWGGYTGFFRDPDFSLRFSAIPPLTFQDFSIPLTPFIFNRSLGYP